MASILVIDDDQELRELLAIALSDEGYEVGIAATASSALDLIRVRHPDVILLDLWLQGQRGERFVEAYRALPNAPAALVLLSAAADLAQVAATSCADRHLAKPFELDDLLQTLAELIPASSIIVDKPEQSVEPVAHGLDDVAVVLDDCRSEQCVMAIERRPHGLGRLLPQRGAGLHVGEEEGHRPARQLGDAVGPPSGNALKEHTYVGW